MGLKGALCVGNQVEQSIPYIMFIDLPSDPMFKLMYRHQLVNVKNMYDWSLTIVS